MRVKMKMMMNTMKMKMNSVREWILKWVKCFEWRAMKGLMPIYAIRHLMRGVMMTVMGNINPFMGNVNILKLKRRTFCHVSFSVARARTIVVREGVTFLRWRVSSQRWCFRLMSGNRKRQDPMLTVCFLLAHDTRPPPRKAHWPLVLFLSVL